MKRVAIFVGCLIVAGCGSNRGNQTTPLTEDQKTQFGGTLESVGRAERSGLDAQKQSHRAVTPPDSHDELMKKMSERMLSGKCDYVVPSTASGTTTPDPLNQSFEQGIKVSGATCPISLDLSVKMKTEMTQTSFRSSFNFNLNYAVKDAEFAKLNDVTAVDIKGSGAVDADQNSVRGDLNVEGKLKSQQYGELTSYIIGKVSSSGDKTNQTITAETVLGVQYPSYTAELKIIEKHSKGQKTRECTLNGQTITEQEFLNWVKKAGTLGQIRAQVKS